MRAYKHGRHLGMEACAGHGSDLWSTKVQVAEWPIMQGQGRQSLLVQPNLFRSWVVAAEQEVPTPISRHLVL